MKLYIVLVAGLASASVDAEPAATRCKPGTYRCEHSGRAWDVCNTSGDWVAAVRRERFASSTSKMGRLTASPTATQRQVHWLSKAIIMPSSAD
ncbi:hypothetical protein NHJ13051_005645 [Beauveria bassiana]